MPNGQPLDVRIIPPHEKHPTIFRRFVGLKVGEDFELINDHDPIPLRRHFDEKHDGAFGWEYLEKGPGVWRVLISRLGPG